MTLPDIPETHDQVAENLLRLKDQFGSKWTFVHTEGMYRGTCDGDTLNSDSALGLATDVSEYLERRRERADMWRSW
jgi:hypothetical protein